VILRGMSDLGMMMIGEVYLLEIVVETSTLVGRVATSVGLYDTHCVDYVGR